MFYLFAAGAQSLAANYRKETENKKFTHYLKLNRREICEEKVIRQMEHTLAMEISDYAQMSDHLFDQAVEQLAQSDARAVDASSDTSSDTSSNSFTESSEDVEEAMEEAVEDTEEETEEETTISVTSDVDEIDPEEFRRHLHEVRETRPVAVTETSEEETTTSATSEASPRGDFSFEDFRRGMPGNMMDEDILNVILMQRVIEESLRMMGQNGAQREQPNPTESDGPIVEEIQSSDDTEENAPNPPAIQDQQEPHSARSSIYSVDWVVCSESIYTPAVIPFKRVIPILTFHAWLIHFCSFPIGLHHP